MRNYRLIANKLKIILWNDETAHGEGSVCRKLGRVNPCSLMFEDRLKDKTETEVSGQKGGAKKLKAEFEYLRSSE